MYLRDKCYGINRMAKSLTIEAFIQSHGLSYHIAQTCVLYAYSHGEKMESEFSQRAQRWSCETSTMSFCVTANLLHRSDFLSSLSQHSCSSHHVLWRPRCCGLESALHWEMADGVTQSAKRIFCVCLSSCQTLKARQAPTQPLRQQRSWRRTADWCESRKRERSSSGYRGRKRKSKIIGNCFKSMLTVNTYIRKMIKIIISTNKALQVIFYGHLKYKKLIPLHVHF